MSHQLLWGNELTLWQSWNTAAAALHWPNQGEATTWMYIGPNGRRFDLEGRHRGRQGVRIAPELAGAFHLPFEHLFTESAYQVGATYERSNINKRVIKAGILLGGKGINAHQYRMIENNWWAAWPHDIPGWLGCHTRFGGWRWAQAMMGEAIEDKVTMDPTTHGNNVQLWNMTIIAPKPWYAKRTLYITWKAHPATVAEHGFDQETISIANRAQLPVWPLFLVKGPGRAWVQDGMTDRMVQLPTLSSEDGYVLVDTDPANRTLTGSSDPVDNIFYDLVRASRILDFLLHDIASLGLPVWRRANGIRFLSQIPPRTVANIKVKHSHPEGTITVLLPQRYIRPS
jgi:hypothetical protein